MNAAHNMNNKAKILKTLVKIHSEMFGGDGREVLREGLRVRTTGRGNKAKSRARTIVNNMILTGEFSSDFDRINRFSV